ncbi:MAG: 1,4-dihydroxy-2-naphthoate octaprenyltransferase [Candidatus Kapabacteria bacterium]|nr:1,4-dihydroxy-2-naphthoate octaprenyltransferase [Candidatus Kapabacteria bacterium]
MEQTINITPSRISVWIRVSRYFSYTATLVPVLLGAAFAFRYHSVANEWILFPISLVCAILLHAGSNLISEYEDYKHQVDRNDTFGGSGVLVEGLIEPRKIYWAGVISLIVSVALGMILVYERGMSVLYLGLVGVFGAYFYTFLKYHAFGDLEIFLMFGPMMAIGNYFVITGGFEWNVVFASIPVGFLVTAILHANNTRDIKHDTESKIKTFASLIGLRASVADYFFLLIGSYISVIIFVALGIVSYPALLVLITVPITIKNLQIMRTADLEKPENIMMLDVQTAQLHLLFGLLYCVGIVVSLWLH